MKANFIVTLLVGLLSIFVFQVNAEEIKLLHENEINEASIIDALAPGIQFRH